MANAWAITPPAGVETSRDYTTSTDVRDVSEVLDAVYLADTPFMNRLRWGATTHNYNIEWISDTIGPGYLILSQGAALTSEASQLVFGTSNVYAGTAASQTALAMRQINTGSVLKVNNATASNVQNQGYILVYDWSTGGSVAFDWLSGCTISAASLSDATTFFIVGNAVAEGSTPRLDQTRPRLLHSNVTQIFRQDVRMTGTRQAIQMHAVPNELRHQIMLRAKEHKRQLERSYILGRKDAGGTTSGDETRLMGGILHYLAGVSGSHIDSSTTSLTESSLNDVLGAMWDYGATPNVILVGPSQARNFATIERARVRVDQDAHVAGFYTTHYMSDLGWDLELLVSRWVPSNFLFVLDTSKIVPRALRGRKYNLQKLGLVGDYVQYQLIAEVTLEFRGYSEGQHGMMYALT